MRNGNLFFHRITENVESALIKRQTAYSEKKIGIGIGNPEFDYYTDALTWRYRKNAWANLYWHCPTGKFPDSLICGSDFVNWKQIDEDTKIKRSNYPKNSNDYGLYEPMSENDTRKVPLILLQSINITNEGRYGSLQKATLEIKAHSMKQLEELESKIMFPGADLRIEYGWTGGLGPKTATSNPDEDNFIGIVYDFGWTMNPDLTFIISIQAVGKGFALTALPSIGLSVVKNDSVSDSNNAKTYADSLITKLRADVKEISSTFKKDKGFAKGKSGGYSMVYAINSIKHDATVKDNNGKQNPSSQTVYYVKLSDIFNYYNEVVLKNLPRISDGNGYHAIKFSANWGIKKGGEGGEQEDPKLEEFFLPCSISILDQEIVSSDPISILFNDCANYNFSWGSNNRKGDWSIPDGSESWAHASFARSSPLGNGNNCSDLSGANLGEILVGVDYLIEVLNRLAAEATTPVAKSVQALGQQLFLKISNCSGELYKLSWIELEMKKSETKDDGSNRVYTENWICVTDPQYSICTPPKWTFGIEKPDTSLVKNISLVSKIPNGLFTQLYVGGRVQNNILASGAVSAVSGVALDGDSIAAPFWLIKGSSGEDHRLRTAECQYFTNITKKDSDTDDNPEEFRFYSYNADGTKNNNSSTTDSIIGNAIATVANTYIGQRENLREKDNFSFENDKFQKEMEDVGFQKGSAWCVVFAELCWKNGYNKAKPLNSEIKKILDDLFSLSVVKTKDNFTNKGKQFGYKLSKPKIPMIGSLMIYEEVNKNGGRTGKGHMGIVIGFNYKDNTVITVEGNTSDVDNKTIEREGYAVAKKERFLNYNAPISNLLLVGFIEPVNFTNKNQNSSVLSSNKKTNTPEEFRFYSYNADGTKNNNFKQNNSVQYTDAKLPEMRALMGSNGYSNETESKLRSALIRYVAERKAGLLTGNVYDQSSDRYMFMRRDLYPLECKITIDGIAGFRFGDAIMVDYLPQRYKTNICFVVTKVLHSISKNGWDTILNLQAKIITNVTQQNLNEKREMGNGRTVQEELNPKIKEREYNELKTEEVDNDSANDEENSKTYPERKNKRNN